MAANYHMQYIVLACCVVCSEAAATITYTKWSDIHRRSGTRSVAVYSSQFAAPKPAVDATFYCVYTYDYGLAFQRKASGKTRFVDLLRVRRIGVGEELYKTGRMNISTLTLKRPYGFVISIHLHRIHSTDAGVYRCKWMDHWQRPNTELTTGLVWNHEIILLSHVRCLRLYSENLIAIPGTVISWRMLYRVNPGGWWPVPNTTFYRGGFWSKPNALETRRIQIIPEHSGKPNLARYLITFITSRVAHIDGISVVDMRYRNFVFKFGLKWIPVANNSARWRVPQTGESTSLFTYTVRSCLIPGCRICTKLGTACLLCKTEKGFYKIGYNCYPDACQSNPCSHGGLCNTTGREHTCKCQKGYSGVFCEIDRNPCRHTPCKNRGVCVKKFNNYTCDCRIGTSGRNCETVCISHCLSCTQDIRMCDERRCMLGYGRNFSDGSCRACVNDCVSCNIALHACDYLGCGPNTGYDAISGSCTRCQDVNCRHCHEDFTRCDAGQCLERYGNRNRNSICRECVSNCISCENNQGRCDPGKCRPTYGVNDISGLCHRCLLAHCLRCDGRGKSCQFCERGFELSIITLRCQRVTSHPSRQLPSGYIRALPDGCIANCLKCGNSDAKCTTCDVGYGYDDDKEACVECKQLRCLKCDVDREACDPGGCMREFGLNLADKTCTKCIPHCDRCDIDPTKCDSGYCFVGFVVNSRRACIPCILGCESCTKNVTRCDVNRCANAFRFRSSDSKCIDCPPNCVSCENNAHRCDVGMCKITHRLDIPSGQCIRTELGATSRQNEASHFALYAVIGMLVALVIVSICAITMVIRRQNEASPPSIATYNAATGRWQHAPIAYHVHGESQHTLDVTTTSGESSRQRMLDNIKSPNQKSVRFDPNSSVTSTSLIPSINALQPYVTDTDSLK